MWIACNVQILFQKYFPIGDTPLLDPEINDFLKGASEEADLRNLEEARQRNIIVPETRSERAAPWFNRIGFLRILVGKSINEFYPIDKCTCGCRD